MQEKPTAALEQELSACADLRAYLKTNTGALCAPGLPALLQQLMQSRGLSRAELLRRSGLNNRLRLPDPRRQTPSGAREPALPVLRIGSGRRADAKAPPARRLRPALHQKAAREHHLLRPERWPPPPLLQPAPLRTRGSDLGVSLNKPLPERRVGQGVLHGQGRIPMASPMRGSCRRRRLMRWTALRSRNCPHLIRHGSRRATFPS